MVRRIKTMMGALALMASTLVAIVLVPASPASAACNVGTLAYAQHGTFTGTNVNIRTGPSTGCAVVAQGQPGHVVRFDCWTSGTSVKRNGTTYNTWSHVLDENVWTSGWVSDAYLSGGGATYQCTANGVSPQ